MPTVSRFDTKGVRSTESDGHGGATYSEKTIRFPCHHVASPRLPYGLSCISIKPRSSDVDGDVHIYVNPTVKNIQNDSAVYRVSAEGNTTLVRAVVNSLNLAPADVDFVTGEHYFDLKEGGALSDVYITFTRKFITPPNVLVFFGLLDIHCQRQARCRISTTSSEIDRERFRLTAQSSSTVHGRIQAYWIAYPADREHIFSISLNMMDLPRPKATADVTHHQMIDFSSRAPFWTVPSVFVALNMLDFDCTPNLFVNAYVDKVKATRSSLTCCVEAGSGNLLHSVGITIIAVN
ncbi:hypothetical protein BYT27DRAFT_7214841 [Phlegmacium glaucopus]|nr:hypothetical protein BYT27DRAFT_7214841 [Phlegmacium glaucopus]